MMKQILIILAVLAAAACIGAAGHYFSESRRLEAKVAQVKATMESWIEDGWDPGDALVLMRQVGKVADDGDVEGAEKLVDEAQALLDVPPAKRHRPRPAPGEEPSRLYADAKPVEITGYDGNAMEPFISPSGHFLFFNSENDPGSNTDLYFAERTGPDKFKFMGPLNGANSSSLDAAASIDKAGHIYFTSAREYSDTMKSVFTGTFDGHEVKNLHTAPGNIDPTKHGSINMDVSISPDGNTLYISRAIFKAGLVGPAASDLMIAHLHNGAFEMDPKSAAIMKNINTSQLEYAPSVSADGRELFFTRSQSPEGKLEGPQFRIMVATRANDAAPFGKPKQLVDFTGLVEAPSVSLDLREMFFHKKVKGKWVIYRAVRK